MTLKEYNEIDIFPCIMVSLVPYEAKHTKLRRGQTFNAVGKKQIGEDDFSIIDENGHPHYYEGCDLLVKE